MYGGANYISLRTYVTETTMPEIVLPHSIPTIGTRDWLIRNVLWMNVKTTHCIVLASRRVQRTLRNGFQ